MREVSPPANGTTTATRRLAAILAADVAGYSQLVEAGKEGTLAGLKAIRREQADAKIKEYRGRIFKTAGDRLLIEFGSVVDAVRCAVKVLLFVSYWRGDGERCPSRPNYIR